MISKLKAENFKHGDFAVELQNHNLIVGPNGSGKSAITEALRIMLMDYVPGVGKRNQDILDGLSTNELGRGGEILLNITTDDGVGLGKSYERHKDVVSQNYFVDGNSCSKDDFVSKRSDIGKPIVFDIGEFWQSSDAKKVDTLFSVYPVGEEDIDKKIDAKKKEINTLHDNKRTAEKIIQQLHTSKAEGQDQGSLHEVNQELMKLNAELKLVEKHYYKMRAQEQAQENEAKRQQAVKDVKETFPGAEIIKEPHKKSTGVSSHPDGPGSPLPDPIVHADAHMGDKITVPVGSVIWSIQKIIKTIINVGCQTCINGAGVMVAKSELRKYQGVENGKQ